MKEATKLAVTLVGFLFVFTVSSPADTYVGGFIAADTHWTLGGSPYIVQDSIGIIEGSTLTIDPDVEVRFDPSRALVIDNGTLVARGTQLSPIHFTVNQGSANRWGYLQFSDNATDATFDDEGNYLAGSILEHVVVEYGGSTSFEGAVRAVNSSPYVHDSVIQYNAKGGIYGYFANSLRIERNSITNNVSSSYYGGGVVLEYCNGAFLSTNTLEYNYRGIKVFICNSLTLKDNMICKNSGGDYGTGVYLYDSDFGTIIGNIINSNDHYSGVYLYYCSFCTLTRNIISNNTAPEGAGIELRRCNYLTFKHNIITENTNDHGAAIYAERSGNITFSGDRITYNHTAPGKTGGIYITDGSDGWNLTGPDTLSAVQIYGNDNYQFYNDNDFGGSFGLTDAGNVDARYVYWGTDDINEIKASIYDFFDDASKGVVFFDPYSFYVPPVGDMDYDCDVDFFDFAVFALAWQTRSGETNWNPACDISDPKDDIIDNIDLLVFVTNWLYSDKY